MPVHLFAAVHTACMHRQRLVTLSPYILAKKNVPKSEGDVTGVLSDGLWGAETAQPMV